MTFFSRQGFTAAHTPEASEESDQLAVKALGSSTQDRDAEDKKHVLTRSKCASGKTEDQDGCTCKNGERPCYWSSIASNDENSNEWISLRLNSMVNNDDTHCCLFV